MSLEYRLELFRNAGRSEEFLEGFRYITEHPLATVNDCPYKAGSQQAISWVIGLQAT